MTARSGTVKRSQSAWSPRAGWPSGWDGYRRDVVDRQARLLERFGLPVNAPGLDPDEAETRHEPRQEESPREDPLRPAALDRQGGVDRLAGEDDLQAVLATL